jgi:hypothetical protein
MIRLLVALIALLFSQAAVADTCATKLMPAFSAAQAQILCARGLNIVNPTSNFETLAGAGTAQGDATAVTGTIFFHRLTGANATVGWRLPAVAATDVGKVHVFLNTTAGVANLYPATGGTINGAAANAVFAALTGIKPIVCYVTAASTWICS